MTNQYATPFQNLVGIGGFDYYTAGTQPSEKGVVPAQKNTLRLWDQKGDPPNIGRGEIIINDFSLQGANHPEGDFSRHSNGFAWSELATSRAGELNPPPTVTTSTFSQSGNYVGVHGAYAFGNQFVGVGSAANNSLFYGTGGLNNITYSPAAAICSLSTTLASGAQRLAVGHIGAAVKLISDTSGTVASTMHTSTNSCWGIIMSGVNATTPGTPVLLMYCGTTIGTKASDADMTTAITTTQTGVNAGGFAIGAVKAGGRAQRAYWAIPRVSNTSGALKFGAEAYMDVWSTDMAGGDLTPSTFTYLPNGILGAVPFRDGLLMHDGTHVVYWDGNDSWDLGIFRRRSSTTSSTSLIDSDERRRVRGLFVRGADCGVVWQWFDQNGVAAGIVYYELYNFESGSWHTAAQFTTLSATAATPDVVLSGRDGLPLPPDGGIAIAFYSTGHQFIWTVIPRAGESYLWQNSLGTGGSYTSDIPNYYNAASLLGCRWWLDETPPGALPGLPTIKRAPKVITEVEFNGNLDYGGTSAGVGFWTFTVKVQGRGLDGTTTYTAYNQTFSQGQPSGHYLRKNPVTARANIQDVQLYLTASSVAAQPSIPLLLPFTIRFAYSKDGKPITSLPEDTRA